MLSEPPTAASDVFALGIIAWELFTGLPLYRGPDLRSILEAVRHTDAPRLEQMNARVPAEIADAVATALHREPAARGQASDLGSSWFVTRNLNFTRDYLETMQKVSLADIERVARHYLVEDNLTVVSLNPRGTPAPGTSQAAVFSAGEPASLVSRNFRFAFTRRCKSSVFGCDTGIAMTPGKISLSDGICAPSNWLTTSTLNPSAARNWASFVTRRAPISLDG